MLAHPNIVKVYDVSFGDLIQYIVMEHIEGITLKQYIEAHGTVNWKDSVDIVMQILRALLPCQSRPKTHGFLFMLFCTYPHPMTDAVFA